MFINKYIKGAAIMLSALTLGSCASDYLDTPTHGTISAEDICKTPETARQAMLGVMGRGMAAPWSDYDFTVGQEFCQGETGLSYYIGELPGSDCFVNFIYDLAPSWVIYYNMEPGYLTAGNYVWNIPFWYHEYAMLAQVNDVLAGIDNAEVNDEADEIALRDFTKGQALTMRAHLLWRLLQVYGPRWVDSNNGEKPTIVLRTSPNDPQDMAVSSMADVLKRCYEDLDNAITCFNAAGKSFRTLNYEVDLNVCYGVYARVAALKNDWTTVRTMAHNARQGKRIATSAEIFNGYTSYNQNEWMWSPSFEAIDNFIYGNWCTFFACNAYGALNDRHTLTINRDLYKHLPATDERSNWWMTYDKLSGLPAAMFYSTVAVNPETGAFKNDRLLSAARAWLKERKPANITGADAYANATTGDQTTSIVRDGAQVKFWCNGETGQDGLCEIPYMRATEMYLYEAEACAELGLTSEAQNLLKEINVPRNPSYTCDLTGQALIDEVRFYRRIELWGEGFCWFDLKRWNVPMVRTAWKAGDINSGNMPGGVECNVPVDQNLGWRHGIPSSELNLNNLVNERVPGEQISQGAE